MDRYSNPMTMILDTTVGVSDLARSIEFYDAIFSVLGHRRSPGWKEDWAGWGPSYDEGVSFWICKPFNGQTPTPGNGTMITFRARNEGEVQAFHAAALAHGGSDEGKPGTRPYYEPSFYVTYARDPDGNKLACVYHRHDPANTTLPTPDTAPVPCPPI
jgi:catechol 2,3-dioxygenase-like lactoylglutathione lyase family enzyme